MKLSREKLKQLVREELQENKPTRAYQQATLAGAGSGYISANPGNPSQGASGVYFQSGDTGLTKHVDTGFRAPEPQSPSGYLGSKNNPIITEPLRFGIEDDTRVAIKFDAIQGWSPERQREFRNDFLNFLQSKVKDPELKKTITSYNQSFNFIDPIGHSRNMSHPWIFFNDPKVLLDINKEFPIFYKDEYRSENILPLIDEKTEKKINDIILLKNKEDQSIKEFKKLTHDKLKQIVKEELTDILKQTIK